MSSPGFWQFAQQAPGKLALAAPDGRHWSRCELRDECEQVILNLQHQGLQAGGCVETTLPNCAELITLKLAVDYLDCFLLTQAPGHGAADPLKIVSPYNRVAATPPVETAQERHLQKMAKISQLMALFDIQTEAQNVHYCGRPLHSPEAMMWAVNSLHYGHPVILVEQWNPQDMLHAIDQYRVTTSYMVTSQFKRLLELPLAVRNQYAVSSTQRMVYSGAPCPPDLKRDMIDWWGLSIYECNAQTSSPKFGTDTNELLHY